MCINTICICLRRFLWILELHKITIWILYAPQGIIGRIVPLEFDIPGNLVAYIHLNKTALRIGLHITTGEGKPVKEENKECLENLKLHSLFRQADIELIQRLITASVGSFYPHKSYVDVIICSKERDPILYLKE